MAQRSATDDLESLPAWQNRRGVKRRKEEPPEYVKEPNVTKMALGMFASHLYFQLPSGPIKRYTVECFIAVSDFIKLSELDVSLGRYTFLALVVGMLGSAFLVVGFGWVLGRGLERMQRTCTARY